MFHSSQVGLISLDTKHAFFFKEKKNPQWQLYEKNLKPHTESIITICAKFLL